MKDRKLDKWDCLLIRITKNCNSNGQVNALRRMQKIWRMRCCLDESYSDQALRPHIAHALVHILDCKESGVTGGGNNHWSTVIEAMAPGNEWQYGLAEGMEYWAKVLAVLSCMIRYTSVKEWDGFISPARYRKEAA